MQLRELRKLVSDNTGKSLSIVLPDGRKIPEYFHITEVGESTKRFIDCGGKVRSGAAAVIQAWPGKNPDHRLSTDKLNGIFRKSAGVVSDESLPVEVEYEDQVISQYPVAAAFADDDSVTIQLALKHTDCLAKADPTLPACCGTDGSCC
jgi:hypothetical protein